jgi:hypothetical protein
MYTITLLKDIFVPVLHPEDGFVDPRNSGPRVFVCGSLMDPEFTAGIVGRRIAMCPAVALDFSRAWGEADGKKMHFLRPDPGGMVIGVALLGLNAQELARLETFEQSPAVRAKTELILKIGDVTLSGITYIKKN